MPTVSFIMPAYNAGKYIAEAIESALAQSFADWELVIVDDCSTDDTLPVARKYAAADSRIRVYESEVNSGSCYLPRLTAARFASGRYLSQLDADDRISPDSLEKLLETQARTDANIVYPGLYSFSDARILPLTSFDTSLIYEGKRLVAKTLNKWQFSAAGGLIAKELYLGNISKTDNINIDYIDEVETRMMIYAATKVAFCPDAKYFYRENPNSITRQGSLRHFSMLHADIELEQFIQAHYMPESEEDLLVRLHRYNNVIGCMHYVCSHSFRDGQGREAWLAISSAATTLRLDGLRGKVPRLMLSLMLISPLAAKAALKAKYILHKQ